MPGRVDPLPKVTSAIQEIMRSDNTPFTILGLILRSVGYLTAHVEIEASFLHLSQMNLGSFHSAESLTALGTKLISSLPSSLRTAGTIRIPVFPPILSVPLRSSSSTNLQHCSWSFGPQKKLFDPQRHKVLIASSPWLSRKRSNPVIAK